MEIVTEGQAKICAYSGKLSKSMPVFYNPEMEKQRNLTVCALSVFQKAAGKQLVVCDPLAGSGVRGIRIKKEVEGIEKVFFNDVTKTHTHL